MPTKIINGRPPNFADIVKVFPLATMPGVLFAFNGAIYFPDGGRIDRHILKHEAVHLQRQGGTEEGALIWWEKYLVDKDFRYHEELLAHKAEYAALLRDTRTPADRQRAVQHVAGKLSHKLYGPMCTPQQAEAAILGRVLTRP